MKNILILIATTFILASCQMRPYQMVKSDALTISTEWKGYNLIIDKNIKDAEKTKTQIHAEMKKHHYFYDPQNAEYVVLVQLFEKPVKMNMLSSDTKNKIFTVRTLRNSMLIQLVETQNYSTIWRSVCSMKNQGALQMHSVLLSSRALEDI
ncbi:hypothetical protein EGI22_16955 [Lacihabitans sp. LS3-19]|uniref:hypothetical protein n=1 Tax=Lacihabitans sp. LS3-19 TaxID=2487335 RepID=UPI0020CBCD10|nr:hypothetical protein [Lacihabitans sp. LS3-19]MCP9769594.1 hypothetical protein [Lacihabitans sp. LS3-19]